MLQPLIRNAQKPKAYITLFLFTYRKTPESLDILSIDGRLQSLMELLAETHWICKVRIIFQFSLLFIFTFLYVFHCKWINNVFT